MATGGKTVSNAVKSSKSAWSSLKTVSRGLHIVGMVFDVVSLPFDTYVFVKGIEDVRKHSTGQGTNSNAANQLQKMIDQLQEHEKKILDIVNLFEADD